MHDPLSRLYRVKLTLLATILVAFGMGLLIFGHWVQHAAGWQWLANWPIIDVGSALFTTGMFGVAWQYVDGRDGEVRDTQRLKRVLAESAPAMRDAVIQGFAFEPSDLARVSTPATLDQIITNGLAIRLGDAGLAREIYADLERQAIRLTERLYDARVSIHLSPGPAPRRRPISSERLLRIVARWEYQMVPVFSTRRFVCTSDLRELDELNAESTGTFAWYLPPSSGLAADDKAAFQLLDFSVDGEPLPIRRSIKGGGQTYTVSLGTKAVESHQPIAVACTYETVISRDEHCFRLNVGQPTKGLNVELNYGDAGIGRVVVLDYITSPEPTRISRSPSGVAERSVFVESDGWVFPRSGVAFVWGDE
jgi:hypothetical protein